MPTAPINTFGGQKLEPVYDSLRALEQCVQLPASVSYARGTVLGELSGVTDVQAVHATAAITAGTFTLSDGTNTTPAINYNDSIAVVNQKLAQAMPAPLPFIASGGPLTTPTDVTLTAEGGGVKPTLTLTPTGVTGGVLSVTHGTTGTAGTPGTFKQYFANATDGSQVPKAVLAYDCATDASGNITIGSLTAGGGPQGETYPGAPAYMAGYYKTNELVGLDQNAVNILGHLVSGSITAGGVLRID